ncbi:hypothetical protein ACFL2A_04010 [Thermodesulfobacteriota bacterium]
MKKLLVAIFIVMLSLSVCFAAEEETEIREFTSDEIGNKEELQAVTKELGHALSIPIMSSADPLGDTGFSIALEASSYELDEAAETLDYSNMFITRGHFIKGLPYNLDIGLGLSQVHESNISSFGVELRWAPLKDDGATPAVGLRATHSKLGGVENLDLATTTLGAEVSKSFAIVTPYAGVELLSSTGEVINEKWGRVTESSANMLLGCNLSLAMIDIALQAEFAENAMYTAKFGVSF